MSSPPVRRPVPVALVDDYDVVLKGLAHLLDEYRDRVMVVEIDANQNVDTPVDCGGYDSVAQRESGDDQMIELIRNPRARHGTVYAWNLQPKHIDSALRRGVHGY